MHCVNEDCTNQVENEDTGLCASCGHAMRKFEQQQRKQQEKKQKAIARQATKVKQQKPIPKVSPKQAAYLSRYSEQKRIWIEGKICDFCKDHRATQVHHMRGRSINTFYDQWARDNDIPLLLDERFWLPVDGFCHHEIEVNPEWAKENGYSMNRL